jgi:membrane protein implicated in regulation of membrane protease activity
MVLGFDRETMLDLTVNVIPLGILVFFIVAFAVANPFGWDNLISGLQFAIVIVTFVLLVVLTYYAGKAIQEAEGEMEVEPGESQTPVAAETEDGADEEPAT